MTPETRAIRQSDEQNFDFSLLTEVERKWLDDGFSASPEHQNAIVGLAQSVQAARHAIDSDLAKSQGLESHLFRADQTRAILDAAQLTETIFDLWNKHADIDGQPYEDGKSDKSAMSKLAFSAALGSALSQESPLCNWCGLNHVGGPENCERAGWQERRLQRALDEVTSQRCEMMRLKSAAEDHEHLIDSLRAALRLCLKEVGSETRRAVDAVLEEK